MLYINKVYISSYHPQSEGFVERVNEIILQSLAMFVSSRQVDCDVFLTAVVYAYNVGISETTGNTPFFHTYRRASIYTRYNYVTTYELITQHRFPSSINEVSNLFGQRHGKGTKPVGSS